MADVLEVFRRGGGVARRDDLLTAGLSPAAVGRRLASGHWCTVVPGVYRPATTPLTPELRLRSVVLRVGPAAVVAGRWAAWWHGLTDQPTAEVHLHLEPRQAGPRWTGVTVTRRPLADADRVRIRGLLVTARARTVLDCAAFPDAESIRDRALQRGTTATSLQTALDRLRPGHGTAAARELLRPLGDGGVSHPERLLLRALREAGVPGWQGGVRVSTSRGRCWLDLAAVRLRLAVEVDGWTVHSRSEAFQADRDRLNALVRAGWTVVRYSALRLTSDLDGVVAEIVALQRQAEGRLVEQSAS